MTKILILKFYFALCISEQFGCIASAAYCTEVIDFKNNRNCAVTEEFWLPTLLIFVLFCSFCGLLDGTALLQLAVSLGLAAAHVQARTAGNGGGRAVPRGADEDQAHCPGSSGGRTLSPGQHFLSVPPQSYAQKKSLWISCAVVLENGVPACQDRNLDLYVIFLGAGSPSDILEDCL